jgi:hypothetical protein
MTNDDSYYYNNLYAIDSYVKRWANATGFRSSVQAIIEDARSYGYMYYMELLRRFEGDEVQVRNYYGKTVQLKLDTYLNSFYRGERWQGVMKNGIVTRFRETPFYVHLDAQDQYGETLAQNPPKGDTSLVARDTYFPEDWSGHLATFVQEAPAPQQPVLRQLVQNALLYSDQNPDFGLQNGRGLDVKGTADKYGLSQNQVRGRWERARTSYKQRHPEVLEALREQQ